MKNKIISISIILVFIFTSLISIEAIAPTPRIELDDYQLTVTDKNNVYVSGTVSICVGQDVGVYDSNGKIMYNSVTLKNSNKQESFKVQIPARNLSEGKNTFKVKSTPVKNLINGSNPKTITVTVNSTSKKKQTITANDISLKVNETKNINAKVNSGLPLTYKSNNPNVATVDPKGVVLGRSEGSTKVTISQSGNAEYQAVTKDIIVRVVKNSSSPSTNNTYTIIFNPSGGSGSTYSQKVEVGKSVKLSPNKFKRDDYTFMGWADSNGRAIYKAGQHIEEFKNVNMDHFQLGTVKYKNGQSIKNLANKGKTIQLYAVWKGNGPKAAVDWGTLIAKDNNFAYGKGQRAHRTGCYFCGTNRDKHTSKYHGKEAKKWNLKKNTISAQSTAQKYDKSYCCNPFVVACYVHGANEAKKCHGGSMSHKSWTKHKNNGRFKKISKGSSLQAGDIFFSSGHVWMCGYKNSKGQWTTIDASGGNWKASSIAIRNKNPKNRSKVKGRVRYYPNN